MACIICVPLGFRLWRRARRTLLSIAWPIGKEDALPDLTRRKSMLRPGKLSLILGLAGALVVPALVSAQAAQKDPDAAGVAAAIRFQKAEDAAAARQARLDAGRAGETNSADRMAAKPAQKESHEGGVAAAIRFQQAEQMAADRQARIDARSDSANSADRIAPDAKTKRPRTTSATARPRNSQ
jgi:hypothetical protein